MKPILSFFLYALCAFVVAGTEPVAAQTANPNFYVPDGPIYTSLLSGNTLYVGGAFSSVGPNIPYGAALSTTTGQPNTAYAKPNAPVNTSVPDGNGGWYVAGEFTQIGTVPRNYLAHLLASGAVDMNWNPNPNFVVRTLLLNGTTLYAGGDFTTIGGQARYGLAALNTTTGLPTSWNPILNGNVTSLAGGEFTLISLL
jgi:trimeric autotransporter adhesin